jgi:hypothetical protein
MAEEFLRYHFKVMKVRHILSGSETIPKVLIFFLSVNFSILWTFTALPHTVFLRNFALISGAIVGLYICVVRHAKLFKTQSIPIWMIVILFLWILIHLLFIGSEHSLQMSEFDSFWKRAFLGSIFAVGLGLTLDNKCPVKVWSIIVAGLFAPTFIYFIKYFATYFLPHLGFTAPDYLILYRSYAEFYVPKISYVFYCLPPLAIALGRLVRIVDENKKMTLSYEMLAWVLAVLLIFTLFYCEEIKNGFAYGAIFIIIAAIKIFNQLKLRLNFVFLIFALCSLVSLTIYGARESVLGRYLIADIECAMLAKPEDVWKSPDPNPPYPINKYGVMVTSTYFDRLFYARVGLRYLQENPFGYGLVQSSFGHLSRNQWPNAPLIQSHSGWLDVALGIGIPGTMLIIIASIFSLSRLGRIVSPWQEFGFCGLGAIALLFLTTEVAQKNYFDTFIWFICLVSAIGLSSSKIHSNERRLGRND